MGAYDFYSNNGLQRTYNNHGIKSLARVVNIPQPALGIGFAEVTSSVPLLVAYSPIMQVPEFSKIEDIDDTFVKVGAGGLDVSTFPQTSYYGEALGGE